MRPTRPAAVRAALSPCRFCGAEVVMAHRKGCNDPDYLALPALKKKKKEKE